MKRKLETLSIAATLFLAAAEAKDAPESPVAREVRDLRAVVERQAKQIDLLTQQVLKLSQIVAEKQGALPADPAPEPAAGAQAAEFAIPKAEAVPTARHHVVVKGETLTSIAKSYNIPLADLLKANKEVNPAKLQIGQSLTIPTAKTPEQPAEKKETP